MMNKIKYILIPVLFLMGAPVLFAGEIRLDRPVNASIPKDLILHWSFDEQSGVEAGNSASTGNAYNGFLFAGAFGAPQFVPGVNAAYGNAIRLQGGVKTDINKDANPHVQWMGDDGLTELDCVSEPFTAGLWIFFERGFTESSVRLLSRGRSQATNANFWDLSLNRIQSAGEWKTALDFTVSDLELEEGSKFVRAWIPGGVEENRWYHFAVTYEPHDNGEADVVLYVDGERAGEGKLIFTAPAIIAADRRLTVGERGVASFQSQFDGRIDDVFIARGIHGFSDMPH